MAWPSPLGLLASRTPRSTARSHYQLGNWFVMLSLTQVPQVIGYFELTVNDR